ncbi:hypothetical protein SRHO_G00114320, partial [Serrasalmus rhombeus]
RIPAQFGDFPAQAHLIQQVGNQSHSLPLSSTVKADFCRTHQGCKTGLSCSCCHSVSHPCTTKPFRWAQVHLGFRFLSIIKAVIPD